MPAPRRTIAAGVLLAGVAAAFFALDLRPVRDSAASTAAPDTPPMPLGAVTALGITDGYDVERRFSGRIEPQQTVDVAFDEPGKIAAVLVAEGDAVRAGDALARLDTELMEIERDRLRELLVTATEEEVVLEGAVRRDEDLARQNLTAERSVDANRISLAQSRGRRADLEGRLALLEARIRRSTLVAPFDGRISGARVDAGASVTAGQPVLRVVEDGMRELRVGVDADLARDLAPGQAVPVRLGAQAALARVGAVLPDLDPATRTRVVLLAVPASAGAIAGDVATLELRQRVEAAGASVPIGALREGPRGLWEVLVAVPDGEAHRVAVEAVEILHAGDEVAFVRGTFAPGALLIAEGHHRFVPGQIVSLLP